MGRTQIVFGDKFFLAKQFTQLAYLFEDLEENSVIMPDGSRIDGFVVEIMAADSLAPATPFNRVEMVDVTDNLAIRLPQPSGTKVWMPTTS